MRVAFTAVATLALMGCNFASSGEKADSTKRAEATDTAVPARQDRLTDSMAAQDPAPAPAAGVNAMFGDPVPSAGAAPLADMAAQAGTGQAGTGQAGAGQAGVAAPAAVDVSAKFPMMKAQVVLDRLGFSPGVVDGKNGQSTKNALSGYQEASSLQVSGTLDEATRRKLAPFNNIAPTRQVTIPATWSQITFQKVADGAEAQSKMDRLGYNDMREKLSERFHTTPETLSALNGGKQQFAAGEQIMVPNVGADRIANGAVDNRSWEQTLQSLGVGSEQPKVDKIIVDKSEGVLRAFDASGKLVAQYTATMGSSHDPLPLGDWKILGTAYNPPFSYNPKLFWDVSDSKSKLQLPPGPNGPVGVVWIDLSKEHYGIHGTSEPQTIGTAQSHGCVRLTNWDAARLAQMVHSGTQAHFQA